MRFRTYNLLQPPCTGWRAGLQGRRGHGSFVSVGGREGSTGSSGSVDIHMFQLPTSHVHCVLRDVNVTCQQMKSTAFMALIT